MAVKIALLVNGRRSTIGRDQITRNKSSEILELIQHTIRANACQAKLGTMTREEVSNEFKKVCKTYRAFPSAWYRINMGGERVGDVILAEIEIMIDIVGTHLDHMDESTARTKANKSKAKSTLPCSTNAASWLILGKTVPPPIKSDHLKNLKEQILSRDEYTIFHLTDAITKYSILDRNARSKERSRFL